MQTEQFKKSLEQVFPGKKVEVIKVEKPIQTSHDVFFVEFTIDGKEKDRFVFKVFPTVPPEYKRPNLKKEVEVLEGIEKSKDILVPQVVFADYSQTIFSTSYFVMKEAIGQPLSQSMEVADTVDKKRAVLKEIAELLVTIHNIDLSYFPSLTKSNYGIVVIQRMVKLLDLLKANPKEVTLEGFNLMEKGVALLQKQIPSETDTALINGDIDMEHIILQPNGEYLILDWDPAEIGDRSWDIYWMAKALPEFIFGYADSLNDFIAFYEDTNKQQLLNKDFYENAGLMWAYVLGWFLEQTLPDHVVAPSIRAVRPIHEEKIDKMLSK